MDNKNVAKVSIIIPAKNESTNVKMTLESITETPVDIPMEIIVIDDGSEDNCCRFIMENEDGWREKGVKFIRTAGIGLANAKNMGADQANGEVLVFSDAHILVEKDWLTKLMATMSQPGVDVLTPAIADFSNPTNVGYGQTWNEKLEVNWLPAPKEISPIPLAPGGFEAVKKEAFVKVGGFDRGFKIWGYEDVEFSFKCWLFGFGVYVTPEVTVKHVFRARHTYYISFNEVNFNLLRMAVSHFNQQRLAKTVNMIKTMPNIEQIITDVAFSDVWAQRKSYLELRQFDDDWFMQKFKIPY